MIRDKLKNYPSNLLFISVLGIVSIGLIGTGYFYKSIESSYNRLTGVKLGAGVCASRVAQSYFSFSNGNVLSAKLEDRFLSQTDECFLKLDEKVKALEINSVSEISTSFYDEFLTFRNLVRNSNTKLNKVAESYSNIDQLKYQMSVKTSREISRLSSKRSFLKVLFIGLMFSLTILLGAFLFIWSKFTSKINRLEEEAQLLMHDYSGNEVRIERLMEKVLDFFNVPVLKNLFVDYHNHVLSSSPNYEKNKALGFNQSSDIDEDYVFKVFNSDPDQTAEISFEKFDFEPKTLTEDSELNEHVLSADSDFDSQDVKVEELSATQIQDLNKIEEITPGMAEVPQSEEVYDFSDVTETDVRFIPEELNSNAEGSNELKAIVKEASQVNEKFVIDMSEDAESTGKSFQSFVASVTRAFLRNNSNSSLSWEFASDYKDFSLKNNHEELEHIIHSLVSRVHKGFEDARLEMTSRIIEVTSKRLAKDLQINFKAKGVLFNTAELEYLSTMDSGLKKLVDISFVMLQKLVLDIKGEIEVQNSFGLDGEQEAIIRVFIPVSLTDLPAIVEKKSGLKSLLKGSKKQILKTLKKENFV